LGKKIIEKYITFTGPEHLEDNMHGNNGGGQGEKARARRS